MINSAFFRSLLAASFLSTLAVNYFGWKMAEFMPAEHVRLLDWQGYFSIVDYKGLRNLNIIIMFIEVAGILGMFLSHIFFVMYFFLVWCYG